MTPLTYAAATGQIEVAIQLLAAGDDPFKEENQHYLSWLRHASRRGHWELIMVMLSHILSSSQYGDVSLQDLLNTALILWALDHSKDTKSAKGKKSEYLRKLLDWGANVNIRFDIGKSTANTLLHCFTQSCDVVSIIEAGFNGINQKNSNGMTPLTAAIYWEHPDLLEAYILYGSDVRYQDYLERNAMHLMWCKMPKMLMAAPRYPSVPEWIESLYHWTQSWPDCAKELFLQGASAIGGDACRCCCSQSGYLPAIFLLNVSCKERCPSQTIWTLEYLAMLRELKATDEAKISLLSMLRFVRSSKQELTHVCCRRLTQDSWISPDSPLPEEDAQEIIAEEEKIINQLEVYMVELSANPYDDLEEIWLPELKTSAIDYVDIAVQYQKKQKVGLELSKINYQAV
jgi:ankyrin repeat protein